MADGALARPAGRGEVLLVVMHGAITAIGPLLIDMYLPAFPAIADDLDIPAAQVQLSLERLATTPALSHRGGLSHQVGTVPNAEPGYRIPARAPSIRDATPPKTRLFSP